MKNNLLNTKSNYICALIIGISIIIGCYVISKSSKYSHAAGGVFIDESTGDLYSLSKTEDGHSVWNKTKGPGNFDSTVNEP
jgi:hypothetical protein